MTAVHEVSAERGSTLWKNGNNISIYASIDLTSPFLEMIIKYYKNIVLLKYY